MSIVFSEEHKALREAVRGFVARHSPMPKIRALMDTEDCVDRELWRRFATELGVLGLAVPVDRGGAGGSAVEQAVVLEELGSSLAMTPYLPTGIMALTALLACDDMRLVPQIVVGECLATVACTEDGDEWDLGAIATTAVPVGEAYVLTGAKSLVPDGLTADILLVLARAGDGPRLFAVRGSATGLLRWPMETLDLTRKMARLEFARTPARPLGRPGTGLDITRAVIGAATLAVVLEQVGGAQRCLDMTVEYAKTRVQFGRPIGGFQAVKHRCADMLVAVESARSAAYDAVRAADSAPDQLPAALSMAKAVCSEAYTFCAGETIQLHGGIGFTWEHDAHLYYRRAHSTALLFGDATYHRERLARELGV